MVKIEINEALVKQVQEAYPESCGMKPTQVVDWLMRWAVLQKKVANALEV